MPSYAVTPGTMPDPFCPQDWQDVLESISSSQSVAIPENTGVVIQAGTPDAADQDKLWVKVDAAVPYVVGSYVYSSGGWRRIPGLPLYYADGSGTPDSITITTGDTISNAGFIAGRVFLVRVANTVTGPTTVTLDSLGAIALKKGNDEDIEASDIRAGQLILIAYDTVSQVWELLNVLPEPVVSATSKTIEGVSIPSAKGNSVSFDFSSLGSVSDYHIWFYRTGVGTDVGWEVGDTLDIISIYCDEGGSKVPFCVQLDGTTVKVMRPVEVGTNLQVANKSGGTVSNIDETKWLIRATAWA